MAPSSFKQPRISVSESFLPGPGFSSRRNSSFSHHLPGSKRNRQRFCLGLFALGLTVMLLTYSNSPFSSSLQSSSVFQREGRTGVSAPASTPAPATLPVQTKDKQKGILAGWSLNGKEKAQEVEGEYDLHSIAEPEDTEETVVATYVPVQEEQKPKPILAHMTPDGKIEQIQTLLYFLLDGGTLPSTDKLDLDKPITLETLSSLGIGGSTGTVQDESWKAMLAKRYPLVVFSKSYCPYSRKAKTILNNMFLTPEPLVIEADLRPDGAALKTLLGHLTGRNTFPNVLISFESIGGGDDVEILYSEGGLIKMLRKAGVSVQKA
ncbi:Glutaredoxin and related proteins [Phaffia rhodozyma]|uniref:Glutaredoxin and related proteins n=1 Tax=Phaffia rhodozyma TaxID=264483 RepID=A0A0F7SN92_PHARH|nr:Glutaredoxin and related proteins [Phaffia rhodozyma]